MTDEVAPSSTLPVEDPPGLVAIDPPGLGGELSVTTKFNVAVSTELNPLLSFTDAVIVAEPPEFCSAVNVSSSRQNLSR